MSNLHKHGILKETLDRIFGIIPLILVKEIRPAVSSGKIVWMKIVYVCSMPVDMVSHEVQIAANNAYCISDQS